MRRDRVHRPDSYNRGLSSSGTEMYAKVETPTERAFQKAFFSLDEMYQSDYSLIGAENQNGISRVSALLRQRGSIGTKNIGCLTYAPAPLLLSPVLL